MYSRSPNKRNKWPWKINNTQKRPRNSGVKDYISTVLVSTATHTPLNIFRSHFRSKTRIASETSSNSKLKWPHASTQLTTRDKIPGNIPFSNSVWKGKSIMKIPNEYVFFRNWYLCYTEQKRILTSISFSNQHTSMFTQLAVKANCVQISFKSSLLPPDRKTSSNDENFARMGSCGLTKPASSVIKTSQERHSWSRGTSGVLLIQAKWRSTSSSGIGYPL